MLRPCDSAGSRRQPPAGAVNGDFELVWKRRVGQRVRARVRHRAGHVADAVVQHAVQLVDRFVVRGLMDRLDASALIDGDVDDHCAGLHRAHHVFGDDDRCASAGNQHGADHQVGVGDVALERAHGSRRA